jgi:hypothetical protein
LDRTLHVLCRRFEAVLAEKVVEVMKKWLSIPSFCQVVKRGSNMKKIVKSGRLGNISVS